jgi:hypothetical protein
MQQVSLSSIHDSQFSFPLSRIVHFEIGRIAIEGQPGQINSLRDPISKITRAKWTRDVA